MPKMKYFVEISSSVMLCTVFKSTSSAVQILHFITGVKLELTLPFLKITI